MTRFQELTSTPALTTDRAPFKIGRLTAVYFAATLLIGAVAVSAFIVSRAENPITETRAAAEVTDGWLPAITAANRQRAAEEASQAMDGWASALLKAEPPVVDGWAPALLKPETSGTDDYALRHINDD